MYLKLTMNISEDKEAEEWIYQLWNGEKELSEQVQPAVADFGRVAQLIMSHSPLPRLITSPRGGAHEPRHLVTIAETTVRHY